MEALLDFSKPLDVALLDAAVTAFYVDGNPQVTQHIHETCKRHYTLQHTARTCVLHDSAGLRMSVCGDGGRGMPNASAAARIPLRRRLPSKHSPSCILSLPDACGPFHMRHCIWSATHACAVSGCIPRAPSACRSSPWRV